MGRRALGDTRPDRIDQRKGVNPCGDALPKRCRHPLSWTESNAVSQQVAIEATSGPPALCSTVGSREAIEALPPEILRDPLMGDALQSSMTRVPGLDRHPTIGIGSTTWGGPVNFRPQLDPWRGGNFKRWHDRCRLLGRLRKQGLPIRPLRGCQSRGSR
jgi:hypothetical protein